MPRFAPGWKFQQVLAHHHDARARVRAVAAHLCKRADAPLEAARGPADTMCLQAPHQRVERLVEGALRAAGNQLVGAHLAQQLLQRVHHGKREGDAHRRRHTHAEAGVQMVAVHVVVRDDGDVRVSRVVERATQQRRIVGEPAVADVLRHAHGHVHAVVAPAFQRRERLADGHLRGKAHVVVHVALAQADGLLAAHVERLGAQALLGERRAHDAAERPRHVGTSTTRRARSLRSNFTG